MEKGEVCSSLLQKEFDHLDNIDHNHSATTAR